MLKDGHNIPAGRACGIPLGLQILSCLTRQGQHLKIYLVHCSDAEK